MKSDEAEPDTAPLSRREEAYERLLEAIIFGDLPSGSAVDEKGLAHRFNIGIAGIRGALARLELEGLVDRQPRVGTRIAPLGVKEMHDVFETRLIVEPVCAALAAQRAEPADIAQLKNFETSFLEIAKSRDTRRLMRTDRMFHQAVAAATKNVLLERQVAVLHNNAVRFWYAHATRLSEADRRHDLNDHLQVVYAIAKRDSEGAREAMRRLLGDYPDFSDFYRRNWSALRPQ